MPVFPCGYCQKSFGNLAAMKIHIASDHSDKFHIEKDSILPLISSVQIPPNGTSLQDDSNNSKLSTNVEHECFPCQLGFVSELDLQNHIDDKHNLNSDETKIKNEIKTAKTRPKRNPKISIEVHDKLQGDEIRNVSRINSQKKKNGNTSCKTDSQETENENSFVENESSAPETSKMSASLEAMSRQNETNDKAEIENKWNCSVCDKTFKFQSRLSRHSIIHNPQNQERSFGCPKCPKKFLRSCYIFSFL